ncbi:protein translocase subunit SecD [Frigoriflavimonas asaccharolytica]|uniref:Multifunctional fusion protein n=1 Tax=Frigoriflavimonas asaccharolytica TaxID=2735899 RepID=A0A8J8G9Z3_9FLAO|nr:protein translocase subunit SecD [Frigoriflavimonas asaccharolytica]NRS92050.1 SecD/SecF fusion protein [Frigoriflavimonas asaccharolytica]
MQGKGLITIVAIILGLICINELLPTWYANKTEKQAMALAGNDQVKYQKEIIRLSKDTLNLGFTKLYYTEAKEKEMKLGLDLKGGINVLLEINQRDLVANLTNYSENPVLIEALNRTDVNQKNSTSTYIDDFFVQFAKVNSEKGTNLKLADPEIFGNTNLSEIKYNSTDAEVKNFVKNRIELSTGTAYEVIRTRIDKMGVTQPNVQRVPGTARISVEMPGVKDIDRVKKMLQTSAKLQFWEIQQLPEVLPYFTQLNNIVTAKADSIGVPKNTNFLKLMGLEQANMGGYTKQGQGSVKLSDTAVVNKILKSKIAIDARPAGIKYTDFMWSYKPEATDAQSLIMYATRGNASKRAPVDGAVETANISYDQLGMVVVDMQMDSEGAKDWNIMTQKNVGKPVAVSLDNVIYTAPNVNEAIPSGRTQISGNFTQEEAQDLVSVLGAGKLPAGAKVVQAEVVGPSLGAESVNAGMYSFIVAFIIIILYMIFYYGGAGIFAVIAMIINLFFLFGILDSINATLTLPGIAGVVLTMGMAVDANVIIYERTKEELALGKGIKEAYSDGFKHAMSAIIDGHFTTLLTAAVLYFFGTGPIKGFAVTLGIGILMTLFTSVLLSRVMIFSWLEKGRNLSVWTSFTKNWFRNTFINFISKRKIAYIVSSILIVVSLVSIAVNGFKFGVDFNGGRNYVVKFDKAVDAQSAEESISKVLVTTGSTTSVDVKTYGSDNQLKITTDYKIDDASVEADFDLENKLFTSLKPLLPPNATLTSFKSGDTDNYGIMSSTKVGPTVADDIKTGGVIALSLALLGIFLYILLRFSRWQFSMGAVLALAHDAIIVLGAYSLFYKVMPFNMEINQDFIAALLTVLGYSINDTVIVFDRIREYLRERKSTTLEGLFDSAISSTIGRTFNTSFTTLLVITIIFIFGGENLRGFMFALLLGIGFGTYSSIFVASALSYDFLKKGDDKKLDKPTSHA